MPAVVQIWFLSQRLAWIWSFGVVYEKGAIPFCNNSSLLSAHHRHRAREYSMEHTFFTSSCQLLQVQFLYYIANLASNSPIFHPLSPSSMLLIVLINGLHLRRRARILSTVSLIPLSPSTSVHLPTSPFATSQNSPDQTDIPPTLSQASSPIPTQ